MKGLGYELVYFIGVAMLLIFIWIGFNHAFAEISDVIIDVSEVESVDNHVETVKNVVYFSLFFIITLGFVWVIKSALSAKEKYG